MSLPPYGAFVTTLPMKIVLIGAGSFVFAPSILHDAIVEHRLERVHLALVDPNVEMAELMAGIGRQMARAADLKVEVTAHGDRLDCLAGADFVICCAAVQLQRRFAMDVEIIHRLAPGHLVTEFGGIQGLSYSLRQIALIKGLAADMHRVCPSAWLLCSANPLPRVCQAAHELGIPTAGFCSNSMGGYGLIGQILRQENESFPWTRTVRRYEAVMAGLNHISFTLALLERETGRDVLADFIAQASRQGAFDHRTGLLIAETGYWPPNGEGHMRDFLPPDEHSWSLELASHGTDEERAERLRTLRAAAAGTSPWKPLLEHRAWEKPMDFVAGLSGIAPAHFHALNLVNDGQLPDLPTGVFVETPASVSFKGPTPRKVSLPGAVARLSRPIAELNGLIVEAGLTLRRDLMYTAVELDPTILDKAAGRTALDACLKAHADLIGSV
jgi:alpha-galactosidase/6-phospho-beta-glucosidase family protein